MSSKVVRYIKVNIAGLTFDIPLVPCPEHKTDADHLRHLLATGELAKVSEVITKFGVEFDSIEEAPITRDTLIENLQDLGFEAFIPRTSSWKCAFIKSNAKATLYFLIGKRDISFKYYDNLRLTKLDDTGKLFTDGGIFVRCFYEKSGIVIHKHILDIALKFSSGVTLSGNDLSNYGQSQKALNEKARLVTQSLTSLESLGSETESQYIPEPGCLASWERD
ncbi:hypothetical protein J4H46_23065 [Vibrio alginolyticus]|uniref:hypothetical protein n=1 Tax=Vibrio TaxID=662 RepID=UPI001967232F|nr:MULTISPECIES: hypothetical protein [Vibrio]EHA1206520.1 hypothetical protein [Vibrio alginolyticus]ELA6773647.1 hypothetical protein [Vibrio alginolyticus]MBN3002022.1 hypothetical protein [Vibrio alginolyticus]MBT0101418.1 hypothetical protein [Vibrio alginolyticus]MCS0237517.1 hypothetical protein [Vibrio alginolyticus]